MVDLVDRGSYYLVPPVPQTFEDGAAYRRFAEATAWRGFGGGLRSVKAGELAGEPITAKLTRAPGNQAAIGGLKVTAAHGWFAARPSGTENIYKIYAESLQDEKHLRRIVAEAQEIVGAALAGK